MGVLFRGREMNKGNHPIMLNILRSKDSSMEESSKKTEAGNAGHKRQEV